MDGWMPYCTALAAAGQSSRLMIVCWVILSLSEPEREATLGVGSLRWDRRIGLALVAGLDSD